MEELAKMTLDEVGAEWRRFGGKARQMLSLILRIYLVRLKRIDSCWIHAWDKYSGTVANVEIISSNQ